jgi:hypothetical protein
MMDFEKSIERLEKKLDLICNALGIGKTSPAKVVDITRKAMCDAARIKERRSKTDQTPLDKT